jgi:hypothetical protein
MTRRLIFALFVCAFALSSCGGGEAGGGPEAEAAIEKAVVAFVASEDPADCGRFSTPRALKQMAKTNYDLALATCEALTLNPLVEGAEKVDVSAIEVEGSSATAVAAVTGSIVGGQTIRFALVEDDDRWKVDEVLGFIDLDEEKLATEWGRLQMLLAVTPQETEAAICVMNRLLKMSEADLEKMYLGENPDPVIELNQSCVSRSDSV